VNHYRTIAQRASEKTSLRRIGWTSPGLLVVAMGLAGCGATSREEPVVHSGEAGPLTSAETDGVVQRDEGVVRFATYNTSLHGDSAGDLAESLSDGGLEKAQRIAAVIQSVRPDVLLLNEFDHDDDGRGIQIFREAYLATSQSGRPPIEYPYTYTNSVNTGVLTDLDINQDGSTDGPEDAFGFGRFPGQYGMVVFSTFPIDVDQVRSFQKFRWKDMPAAKLPVNPNTVESYYREEIEDLFRLSSKSH